MNNDLVEFIGIKDMPQFNKLKKTYLLEKKESGMGFIVHPQGYFNKNFNCNVLFVDLKVHIKHL